MEGRDWTDEFPASVVVTGADGTILYMNGRAAATFAAEGGAALVGHDVRDCHPPAAREKVEELFATRRLNAYTIEKNGVRKLIYQSPWYDGVSSRDSWSCRSRFPGRCPTSSGAQRRAANSSIPACVQTPPCARVSKCRLERQHHRQYDRRGDSQCHGQGAAREEASPPAVRAVALHLGVKSRRRSKEPSPASIDLTPPSRLIFFGAEPPALNGLCGL